MAELGNLISYEVKKSNLKLTSFAVSPQKEATQGDTVSLTAKISGGTGSCQYQYFVIRDGKEIVVGDYRTASSFNWVPLTPADYQIGVRVKDSTGTVVESDTLISYTVKKSQFRVDKFTSTISGTIKVGESTKLTASAKEGAVPYSYKFYVVRGGQEIVLHDYSSENSYTWSPLTPADYEVFVSIKDSLGVVVTKSLNMTVKKMSVTNLSVGKNNQVLVNQKVYIKAGVSDNVGEVRYRFYTVKDGKETEIRGLSLNDFCVWSPSAAGTYKVGVEAKDIKGNISKKENTITVNASDFKISSFTTSKTGTAYKGDNITMSASATGGKSGTGYLYRFYVIRDGQEILLQDYSTKNSYIWGPITLADYYMCVDAKDANGLVTTDMKFIKIAAKANTGIDVSSWQTNINWSNVKQDGISFAMLRVVEGANINTMKTDTQYNYNVKNARANNIPVGVYRYGYGVTVAEAQKEALAVVNSIKNGGYRIQYPVAYDVEGDAQGKLSKSKLTEIIKAFKTVIEMNGYDFMLYANKWWLTSKIDMNAFANEDVWIASYNYDYSPALGHGYTGKGNIAIWQYSSRGRVSGVSGDVDMNIGYKNY
ncbi:hypothetical protein DWW31_14795 [Clostridium sp. AF15-17LB]|nr:hypothetical protein DWW31_14795 [Clostridium sp. AF15-17LB]